MIFWGVIIYRRSISKPYIVFSFNICQRFDACGHTKYIFEIMQSNKLSSSHREDEESFQKLYVFRSCSFLSATCPYKKIQKAPVNTTSTPSPHTLAVTWYATGRAPSLTSCVVPVWVGCPRTTLVGLAATSAPNYSVRRLGALVSPTTAYVESLSLQPRLEWRKPAQNADIGWHLPAFSLQDSLQNLSHLISSALPVVHHW